MNDWHFDPISALIGAVTTLGLVGILYIFRKSLSQGWQEVQSAFRRSLEWLTASVETQYRQAVVAWAEKAHALSAVASLDQVFVPPHLMPPPSHPDPETLVTAQRESLPLDILVSGHERIAVVGDLSSGRSTLLAYLALAHAWRGESPPVDLPVNRIPLYIDLTGINWSSPDVQEELLDELEDQEPQESEEEEKLPSLMDLAQRALRTIGASSSMAKMLRQRLEAGHALVLVDGWDELDLWEQSEAAAWMNHLIDAEPGNMWIVATGLRGFAPLINAGFVPVHLEEWDRPQVEALLSRLGEFISSDEEGIPKQSEMVNDLMRNLTKYPSLLDLVLRARLLLATGKTPDSRAELYMQSIDQLVDTSEEKAWLPVAARVTLGNLALMMLQENRTSATKEELEAAWEVAQPAPEEGASRASVQALKPLLDAGGPLVTRGAQVTFSHPLWRASLAARQMTALPPADLVGYLDDPRWLPALAFYAESGRMEPVLKTWFSKPEDLWHTRMRTAALWATLAPPEASWRSGVMALLARKSVSTNLPLWARQQLVTALARTRDPGVPTFLRQAMQHPEEGVRVIAAYAMGLLGERAELNALTEALSDPADAVRSAAAQALGHIGTSASIRWLTQALVEGDDALRIEAARALARTGGEGWEILQEATEEEDFLIRRAAIYGLGELETEWAQEILKRTARDDPEWIVRSAASTVISEAEEARPSPVPPLPVISDMGWLIAWTAERGEGVGLGEAAFGPLLQSMEEGTPPIRKAAAHTLGWVGRPEHVDALRRAMEDSSEEVAQTALWALEELACRYNLVVQ